MIHLIADKEHEHFDLLRKYYAVNRFYSIKSYKAFLNNKNALLSRKPVAIICMEEINSHKIYSLFTDRWCKTYMSGIPLLVIKSELKGNEVQYIEKQLINDYIDEHSNIDDVAERIRYFLVQKNRSDEKKGSGSVEDRELQYYQLARRFMDFTFSSCALILLSPLLALIALLIKFESDGPVFYISKRAGNGYNVFNIYKFRTMVKDADKKLKQYGDRNQYCQNDKNNARFIKLSDDPRITRLGILLRRTSLDEIPQLINVLKGDMSLIGNRPLPLYEAERMTCDHDSLRFNAPAGITGLWQVEKRGRDDMSEEERINLDNLYARKYNLYLDMKIFLKTFPALIQNNNS